MVARPAPDLGLLCRRRIRRAPAPRGELVRDDDRVTRALVAAGGISGHVEKLRATNINISKHWGQMYRRTSEEF